MLLLFTHPVFYAVPWFVIYCCPCSLYLYVMQQFCVCQNSKITSRKASIIKFLGSSSLLEMLGICVDKIILDLGLYISNVCLACLADNL
uniref:Uncharacterized protein n=1 Tax=Rhizophora mucronata TaxID=61149 RepID=A0A2P2QUH3_RHIMU